MSENIAVKIHDERRVNLMLKVMNFFGDAPPDSGELLCRPHSRC